MSQDSQDSNPYCHCLFYTANALARTLTRLSEEAFASSGLAPSLAFTLMAVNRRPGIQPNEIASLMMLSPSTVSRLVEKLEGKDLLRREAKGKTILVFPTPRGEELLPALREAWQRTHAAYTARLGADNARQLADQLYLAARSLE